MPPAFDEFQHVDAFGKSVTIDAYRIVGEASRRGQIVQPVAAEVVEIIAKFALHGHAVEQIMRGGVAERRSMLEDNDLAR